MKICLVVCLLVSCIAAEDLRSILRSPQETLKLYSGYKAKQHLSFGASEDRMRFRLFRSNAEFVADANEQGSSAVFALNFFSAMTADEKRQYLGLNITGHQPNDPLLSSPSPQGQVPAKKLWTNEGAVTEVKNQGSCGSCWTFGAVGGLETRYQQLSGVLRNFAEQEYLDCVYEGFRDGCNGGWPDDCYTYSANNGGRLAATKDYHYGPVDVKCEADHKPNALVAYKITGFDNVRAGEKANIAALAKGSLAVAFEVTNYFQQYSKGIIKDTTCSGRPNHAVTAVGYTENFVLVKNSWGSGWGDEGFVKFARNHDNCGLFDYSSYPSLKPTGQTDSTPADAASSYRPSEDDVVCEDVSQYCRLDHCQYEDLIEYCRETCNKCGDEDQGGDCPSGTIRCDDGVCRHEHMC